MAQNQKQLDVGESKATSWSEMHAKKEQWEITAQTIYKYGDCQSKVWLNSHNSSTKQIKEQIMGADASSL